MSSFTCTPPPLIRTSLPFRSMSSFTNSPLPKPPPTTFSKLITANRSFYINNRTVTLTHNLLTGRKSLVLDGSVLLVTTPPLYVEGTNCVDFFVDEHLYRLHVRPFRFAFRYEIEDVDDESSEEHGDERSDTLMMPLL